MAEHEDQEIEAMRMIAQVYEPLDEAARRRVQKWMTDRFNTTRDTLMDEITASVKRYEDLTAELERRGIVCACGHNGAMHRPIELDCRRTDCACSGFVPASTGDEETT